MESCPSHSKLCDQIYQNYNEILDIFGIEVSET